MARQASIRFSGLMFDKMLGYLFALFVTKTYGSTGFGLYLFGVSLIEILFVVARLGLDRSSVRAAASLAATGKFAEIKGVARASLLITSLSGIALAAALFFFNQSLSNAMARPGLADFLSIAAIAVPASVMADVFLWPTEAIGSQRYFALVRNVFEPIVKISLAVVFFVASAGSANARSLGIAYAISILAGATLSFLVYLRVIAARYGERARESHIKELLRVGLPVCGQNLLGRALAQTDIFLLFTLVSAASTAHYTVAARTAMLMAMISFAFEAAFRPAAAAVLARGERLTPLYRSVSRSVLMLCLPAAVVLILFPARVMAVVGDQFINAAPVVRWIAAGATASFILGPAASALMMAGRSRTPLINGIIAGMISLALNLILIPRIGLAGAGIAQCVSWVASSALNAVAAHRLLKIFSIGRRHAPLLIAAALASIVALLVEQVAPENKYLSLALVGAAALTAYAATLLMIGVAQEDRRFIRSILLIGQKQKITK
ncbi:MAG: polysaccharide biosynthesis C-terminal domain-containing protein [Acidobacteriota bacterium]